MFDSGSQTLREDMNATIRETSDSNATVRGGQSTSGAGTFGVGGGFRDYRIVRQLPSTSTEADIFVIEKDGTEYILKLYRYGIEPKNDILQSIKTLSETYPQNFIHVYEADFDKGSSRWFEVQEYAKFGTLQALIDDRSKLTDTQKFLFFNDVARGVGEALNLLHQNNLLHLDIKPSNILLRSMDPLNMVLIDFGIATSLASDMSKKFTQTRGTPMYQSPESYTGGMGRASDWWGLGMILLEIANGSHPFKGLSPNVIAYAITTEPVHVPETLDAGKRELLHGLLTRDPAKRWNWERLVRWLGGERGIPQFFEAGAPAKVEASASDVKPLVFMEQPCRSLAELAAAFVKDEESWEKGKAFLMRGYVMRWLEEIGDYDASADMDVAISGTEDTDEKVFRFVQRFGKDIPPAFCGHLITLQNLFLFAGKALRRENITPMVQWIVDSLHDGHLLGYMDACVHQETDETKAIRTALRKFKGKELKEIVSLLDFYLHSEKYYCPFVKDASTVESVVKDSEGLQCIPILLKHFEDIKSVIPSSIINDMQKAASYHKGLSSLTSEDVLTSAIKHDDSKALAALLDISVIDLQAVMMRAARYNAIGVFNMLMGNGTDVNVKDGTGKTLLMCAAEGNAVDVFKRLLERGADINAKDNSGKTVSMIAEESNADDILEIILEIAVKYSPRAPVLNSTYSGNYLGDTFTQKQSRAIRTGTFTGMALGDYWTIDGVNWRIADFDYLIRTNKVDAGKHHVMIVPDTSLYRASMNSTDTISGGYAASEMRRSGLDPAKDMINRAFGNEHILPDYGVELMTKEMVFEEGAMLLSLFRLKRDFIKTDKHICLYYWLQNIVSSACFAFVSGSGLADYTGASYSGGVRPAFAIY